VKRINTFIKAAKYIIQYFYKMVLRAFGIGVKRDLFLNEKFYLLKNFYGATCLDVGCGYANFTNFLISEDIETTGLDIVDESKHKDVPFFKFNGLHIPFEDQSFDTSIIMFTLHHADDQDAILNEVIRVTRKTIIIAEDVIETPFDRILANFHLETSVWSKGTDSFHSNKRWQDIFKQKNLHLEAVLPIPRYREPLYPVARCVYALSIVRKK